jgi:protein-disulfide isomerase
MAIACKYQDKYVQAHDALIGTNSKLTEPRIDELLAAGGIDVDRARRDRDANAAAIDGLLSRNDAQARGLNFNGTPSFIVGKFRVPGVLTMAQFEQVISDARKVKAAQ